MKSRLFFITTICFSAFHCFSQQAGSISLTIGPAFPVGEFANLDANSTASGLANLGGLADLSYTHRTRNSDFGFIATLRTRANPINTKATLGPFEEQYPGYGWSVTKKPWEAAAAMVGGYHSHMVTKKLYLEEALLFGAAETVLPGNTITGIEYGAAGQPAENLILSSNNKISAGSFSGLVKLTGGFPLTRRLDFVAQLDYWYLTPVFKNLTQVLVKASGFAVSGPYSLQNATSIEVGESTIGSYSQHMNSIDLTIGISLKLGN